MSIINRRNAVVGWLALSVGKRALKKKARDAAPSVDPETKRPNKSAVALTFAGVLGGLAFWRKRSGGGGDADPDPDSFNA